MNLNQKDMEKRLNVIPRIIKTDGTVQEIQPKNGKGFKFEELHEYVDGFIEIVRCGRGVLLIVDEEGKLKQKPLNTMATGIFQMLCHTNEVIAGDVVICSDKMVK